MEPKKKILIVDDSKELGNIMQDMLTFKGYEVTVENDGTKAVARALAEKPDLMLLDLRMPNIHGFDIVKALREDAWGKTAKILILTATDSLNEIPPGIGISSNDYMMKSVWGIEEVETRVRSKLAE